MSAQPHPAVDRNTANHKKKKINNTYLDYVNNVGLHYFYTHIYTYLNFFFFYISYPSKKLSANDLFSECVLN